MKISDEALKIAECIRDFLTVKLPSETDSEATIKNYRVTIGMYLDNLEIDEGVTCERLGFKYFGSDFVRRWLERLRNKRGNSNATQNRRLSMLRCLIVYMCNSLKRPELMALKLDIENIKLMKESRRLIDTLTPEVLKAIFAQPDLTIRTGKRDHALMLALYATGARIDELLSLKIGMVTIDHHPYSVRLHGNKTYKERRVAITASVAKVLRFYIKEFHGSEVNTNDFVFYARRADGRRDTKLTQPAVNKRIKMYAEKARKVCPEVPEDVHAHIFRHSRATNWFEEGMNPVQVQRLLGHASLETTSRYINMTEKILQDGVKKILSDKEKKIAPAWKKGDTLRGLCKV